MPIVNVFLVVAILGLSAAFALISAHVAGLGLFKAARRRAVAALSLVLLCACLAALTLQVTVIAARLLLELIKVVF